MTNCKQAASLILHSLLFPPPPLSQWQEPPEGTLTSVMGSQIMLQCANDDNVRLRLQTWLTVGLADVGRALERSNNNKTQRHEHRIHDGHVHLAQVLHHHPITVQHDSPISHFASQEPCSDDHAACVQSTQGLYTSSAKQQASSAIEFSLMSEAWTHFSLILHLLAMAS